MYMCVYVIIIIVIVIVFIIIIIIFISISTIHIIHTYILLRLPSGRRGIRNMYIAYDIDTIQHYVYIYIYIHTSNVL